MSDIDNKNEVFGETQAGGENNNLNNETSYFEDGNFNVNKGNNNAEQSPYFEEGTIGNEANLGNEAIEENKVIQNGENSGNQNSDGGAYNGTIQEFNVVNSNATANNTAGTAIAKQSLWYKIKSFFLLDVNLSAPVGSSNQEYSEGASENKSFFKGLVGFFKGSK